jgi:copper chaperone for superoxide dismutase
VWEKTGAAVCILEAHSISTMDRILGLIRMVQVSPCLTVIDLTIRGLPEGEYCVTIRETGDISQGAISTGELWKKDQINPKGELGLVVVGENGMGNIVIGTPLQIGEVTGRAMVISREKEVEGKFKSNDNTLVGVIARSAGVWDNDKTVCSCSGKTLWEERRDQVKRGMV